ncbi:phosphate signaling complex protein PhoU [Haloimpatiens lingqiaonensis]|uniref:phosphate signaling complex protein PhoU n=1 Tax=Haloimpatiens lingqiaonensis TaxID=1380675 RepID=UPI0010FD5ED8|nr:phosphate signaling complex protein PhoU [Haloimpatiens lingqiaonensis]
MVREVFKAKLQELHKELLSMGNVAEKQISLSIEALINHNGDLANKIIKDDDIVDNMQKEIEDRCIKLIAMQQPLASDLRYIFTTSKIVTDLERIADHAVDIAKITGILKDEVYIKELIDIPRMAEIVEHMLKESLDSYIEADVSKAYNVCKMDDKVDAIYRQVFSELLIIMMKDIKTINQATQFLFICKYLERIADHITNICEWTIYLVTGEQVDLNE